MNNSKKNAYKEMIVGSGGGKGGGGSARTPVESPDSLHNTSYATILSIISNGEVYGPVHSRSPLRDVYLDGTPVQNDDGSLNFNNVQLDYRTGTVDQLYIKGLPSSSTVIDAGVEIKTSRPWVQAFTNSDLSAIRVSVHVPSLVKTIDSGKKAGDRVGYKVEYAIDLSLDGGSYVNVLTASFDGKTINGYTRTHRVDLPQGSSSWSIKVRRITKESNSTLISDKIFLQNYAEVIDGKFRYPMTALVGIRIDAEQFKSIPKMANRWKGLIVRVPSNYDPIERKYSGTWDGTFKRSWSDNPAWVFYDMVTSNLYGLGDYVNASMIDRYALYQISAYCDQLVSDGQGGQEPRFTCNAYIQSQQDALRVLNDLSSIFRGMSYWAGGVVVPVADMPSDPIYTYTNANVIDGRFEYAGADISTRKTVALVSWNDPTDFYRSKVEAVEDSDGIARYGIRKTDVIAFGCSSRGQAQRAGLYILYTSRMETESITFSVGLDGVIPQPGSIVKVADRNRAGRSIGGRIRSATDNYIIVDRDHPAKVGDTLTVNMPDGTVESRGIVSVDGRKISVVDGFTVTPSSQSAWAIDADDLVTQQVRIVSIKEQDDITFSVMGVFHRPDKFNAIDNGVRLDPLPVSVVPPRTQTAPTNIVINQHYSFHQGTTRHWAEISWGAPDNAVLYDVQWRRDNGDWVSMPRTGTRLVQIDDIFAGTYTVRVRAINSLDVPSLWAYSDATLLDGQAGAPPKLASLTTVSQVMAIDVKWSYPDTPNIVSKVELVASLNNRFANSNPVTQASYPATNHTLYGLGYGTEMWFWARLIDKNGLPGEWYPSESGAGVLGTSSSDANDILGYLEGQIGEGQLAQDLVDTIDGIELGLGDLGTQVSNEVTERESADSALAESVSTVAATASSNTAAIKKEETARADADSALTKSVSTLQSSVDGNEALIQQASQALADIDGALSSSWQVKTQVRQDGRVVQAGVAIGASINPDGTSRSEALFMADTVAFLNKLDGKLHSPFIFDVANDTAILNSAIIGSATIGFAKIKDDLQSNDWNWNGGEFEGWKIEKGGNVYFDSGVFKGTVYANNGEFNGTVNANNGVLNNVTINENCSIKGTLSANQIIGDVVSAQSKKLYSGEFYNDFVTLVSFSVKESSSGIDRTLSVGSVLLSGGYRSSSGTHIKIIAEVIINGSIAQRVEAIVRTGSLVTIPGASAVIGTSAATGFIQVRVARQGDGSSPVGTCLSTTCTANVYRTGSEFN